MTEQAIDKAARRAAEAILEVIASALHPCVHRDFLEEAERIARDLIRACNRQAGRERMRLINKPSLN